MKIPKIKFVELNLIVAMEVGIGPGAEVTVRFSGLSVGIAARLSEYFSFRFDQFDHTVFVLPPAVMKSPELQKIFATLCATAMTGYVALSQGLGVLVSKPEAIEAGLSGLPCALATRGTMTATTDNMQTVHDKFRNSPNGELRRFALLLNEIVLKTLEVKKSEKGT